MSSFCQRVDEIYPLLFSVLSIMEKIQQINKRATPIIVTLGIVLSVVFGSYDTVKATGMTELYMTYWDLYNSIFASTGYSMKIKDGAEDYNNANRVTGKQAWHNFCKYVKIHAKDVYDEAVALPKFVTAEGIKMSQDLWKAAQDYAATFVSSSGTISYKSLKQVQDVLATSLGIDSEYFVGSCINDIASGKEDMYCVRFSDTSDPVGYEYYIVFGIPAGASFVDFKWNYYGTRMQYVNVDGSTESRQQNVFEVVKRDGNITVHDYHDMGWTFRDYCKGGTQQWIIRGGVRVKEDEPPVITDPARQLPEKVREDEYIPWLTWADLDVKMREATDDNEDKGHKDDDGDNDDNDKDKNGKSWKDIIPALIPFSLPDSSDKDKDKDKDTEQSTEKTSVSPIINPETGNVIDPETGYDIDPETGKLIDPETGKLIDRDMSDTSNKLLKYGDIRKIFPFCIPFDIVDMIRGLRAEKAPPVFHFDYYFKGIDYTFTVDVDLSDYDKYIKLFRGGMVIFFVLALMWLTVKVSKFFS